MNDIDFDDFKHYTGILVESGKKVRFTLYSGFGEIEIGHCFNCVDKKNLQQKYKVIGIKDGVYYFEKMWYDGEKHE